MERKTRKKRKWKKRVEEMSQDERKKIREEERRNEAKALPNRDSDHSLHHFLVLCSSCDSRIVLFLRIEYDLCTLRGPLFYYVHILLLHLSLIISFFFVNFNLNQSLVS